MTGIKYHKSLIISDKWLLRRNLINKILNYVIGSVHKTTSINESKTKNINKKLT